MKKWKVHLIHHTHFDIGYTHTQQEVLDIQDRNQELAMDLVDANRNRSENAQFRWNPEATWALKEWLQKADQKETDRFVSMVRSGHIGLDGLFANMHTALCRPEELIRMMDWKGEFEKLTGVTIDSAMITDVPGWNWGMVAALREKGISYLSAGTNVFDRIGYTIEKWGDKPFYWVSPSGKEKILLWVHGKGYSWFHTGLNKTGNLKNKLQYRRIRHYLNSLERKNYPYDTVIIRYNIGSDNGPPDVNLSRIVEEWNEKHNDIELVISTTSAAMKDFENRYGKDLPEYRGDFTAHWEDGALSTARETAIAREASERLIQAGNLFAMTGQECPEAEMSRAWEDVLLFNEHTWGAHNSISKPDHPFAKSQWAWKAQRALNGESEAGNLIEKALGSKPESDSFYSSILKPSTVVQGSGQEIRVYNSNSWEVSRVVEVATEFSSVLDSQGNSVPSQRLSNGRLAFFAAAVPPFGNSRFTLSDAESDPVPSGCSVAHGLLANDRLSCTIDEKTGEVLSIKLDGTEYAGSGKGEKFNSYVLVPGKYPSFRKTEDTEKGVSVDILDNGPVRAAVRIRRKAPRCLEYVTEISLDMHSDELRIHNILDRPVSRKKEGIHFAFPLSVEKGTLRYDSAWGTVELDKDQLPGANRNFISASRWVDASDSRKGISCVLLDAPIFKSGKLIHDPVRTGPARLCGWKEHVDFQGTVYSYVMNNYWQTNFKADQPGKTLFRYVFRPHGAFSSEDNYRSALENMQPLVVLSGEGRECADLPVPTNQSIVISSADRREDSLQLRLVNISGREESTDLAVNQNRINNSTITLAPGEMTVVELPVDKESK